MSDAGRAPNTTDFQPDFAARLNTFRDALTKAGISNSIDSGYRSPEYQAQMRANHDAVQAKQPLPYPNVEAPTVVAPAWSSFHNYGLAADIHLGNQADYARMAAMAPQYGLSGIGASDPGHIQMAGSLRDNISQYKLAGWRPDSQPAPATGAIAYNGPVAGTTINSANAPTPGALAKPSYTFNLPANAPMGMGNNNPLNIKYYKGAENDHPGLIGPSSNTDQGDPQMKFESPEAGWNAAYSLLNKKYSGGMTTPNQIIAGKGGWTPGNTQAALNVAKLAGIGPDDDIGFADPNKAKKFMRALVTQEQGAAGSAYPDEMIAASIGGNAPASGAPAVASNAAPASTTAKPDDRSWLDKLIGSPVDAQGNPTGAKSPLQELSQASIARLGSEGQTERQEAPAQSALSMQGPAAHVPTGPSQAYGMTLNSFSTPLTWTSKAGALPGLTQAGLQGGLASVPGVSLNSLLPSSQGLGYGVNDVGYGFG